MQAYVSQQEQQFERMIFFHVRLDIFVCEIWHWYHYEIEKTAAQKM